MLNFWTGITNDLQVYSERLKKNEKCCRPYVVEKASSFVIIMTKHDKKTRYMTLSSPNRYTDAKNSEHTHTNYDQSEELRSKINERLLFECLPIFV